MDKKIDVLLIDGNNLAHRSYHGMKKSDLRTFEGDPIWAVHGFLISVSKLISKFQPKNIIICFDSEGSNNIRREIQVTYKKNREKRSEELNLQFVHLYYILNNIGFTICKISDREADDILASLAKYYKKINKSVGIYSTDRDLYQVIDKNVFVINNKYDVIDYNKIIDIYGITPKQYFEMAAIRGESGDNIIGIKGIGERGALKLLKEYGTINNIIENNIKNKNTEKILENIELFMSNIKIAKLYEDIPVAGYAEHAELSHNNYNFEILKSYGLNKAYHELLSLKEK
jgi:DNA polymerase-1